MTLVRELLSFQWYVRLVRELLSFHCCHFRYVKASEGTVVILVVYDTSEGTVVISVGDSSEGTVVI